MREREIDRERDGDQVNEIGLQQWRRSSATATRSVLSGLRTRLVLGGLGIVGRGFKRSVSLATWERRIGDVGGEMGFTGVRGDLELAFACGWSYVSLSLVRGVEL